MNRYLHRPHGIILITSPLKPALTNRRYPPTPHHTHFPTSTHHIGTEGIDILKKCSRDIKVIAIGGNQLTGKSTLCNNLLIKLSEDHYNTAIKHEKTPHNVAFLSAGQVFRQIAKMRGLQVGQLSKQAQANPDIDISIEYESCKGIMGGIRYTGRDVRSILNLELDDQGRAIRRLDDPNGSPNADDDESGSEDSDDELINSAGQDQQQQQDGEKGKPMNAKAKRIKESKQFYPPTYPEHTVIIEGRNPAVMAAYCERVLGKTDITTVYLYCSPREQATRYIAREIGPELAKELTSLLPNTEYQTLTEASHDLKIVLKAIEGKNYGELPIKAHNQQVLDDLTESIAEIHSCVDKFVLNESRDADDRLRYRLTYDFPEALDYTSPDLYDHIIDTSDILAEDTLNAVYHHLPDNIKVLDEFYHKQTL